MKCPSCRKILPEIEGMVVCPYCRQDLTMLECSFCGAKLPKIEGITYCPLCRARLAFPEKPANVHNDLYLISRDWLGSTSDFCACILDLTTHTKNAAARRDILPIDLVTRPQEWLMLNMRNVGQKFSQEIIDKRNRWKPLTTGRVHPDLYVVASGWKWTTHAFCINVLGTKNACANIVQRSGALPLSLIIGTKGSLCAIDGVGTKYANEIIDRRTNWKPEQQ